MSTREQLAERWHLVQARSDAERKLHERTLQLHAALNNMMQGLCMFDADGRVVLFNQRYVSMIEVPSERLMGMSLLELMRLRKQMGKFAGDPESLVADVMACVRAKRSFTRIFESEDGRSLRIVDQPMDNGGWVATFEDITEQRKFERELERQRDFYHQILDNVPAMVVVKDAAERRFVHANRAAEAFWRFSRHDAIGKTLRELFPQSRAEAIDKDDVEALARGTGSDQEPHRSVVISGDERIVSTRRHPVLGEDGKPLYLVSVVEDMTERKRLEQEHERDREFLHQLIENVPAIIVVKNVRTGRYILVNQAGVEHFGLPRDRIVGRTPHEVFTRKAADIIEAHDAEVVRSQGSLYFDEYPVVTPARGTRYITVRKILVRDGEGEPHYIIGVIEDVTERRRSAEQIAYLAHHDALTELPNRVHFRDRLDEALKRVGRGEQLAVLYVDLDKFKGVNDTHGHQGGDELLRMVAARLRGCVRETDIVARLGGDEFAVVQTAVAGPDDIIDLVTRVQGALRAPCELLGGRFSTDASIGIAIAPADGTSPDALLKNADLAMYGAKADGRGTYRFFESDMDARVKERRALEFDLRESAMCGEFELHYQPQLNMADGRISGCEALLRWRHPKRGMVSPVEFIPIAEETGIIHQLGDWALRCACAEAVGWRNDIVVSVNVSPVQFKNGSLIDSVVGALAESGLPAERLELEITESVLLGDDEATHATLRRLKELGVRIAMDDFGTGYSSLNYLRRFPFDKIKIDRSFIKDMAEPDGALAIVQAVVSIAQSRNIATTAEGVETEQQLELLRSLGCTEIQGFWFSRPQPPGELAAMLRPEPATARSVA